MSKFGISQDVASTGRVSFGAGIKERCYLTEVAIKKIGKEGSEIEVLSFHFVSSIKDGIIPQEVTINELQLDESKPKFEKSLEAFNKRIKHIYEAFAPFPKDGFKAENATTFLEYMQAIADFFNTNVGTAEEPKTVFKGKEVDLKLTYSDKGYLGFNYSPNFIQGSGDRKRNNILVITPGDNLQMPAKTKKSNPFDNGEGGAPDPWGAGDGGFPNV